MTGTELNRAILAGGTDLSLLLPHLVSLREQPFVFATEIGLDELPGEPGVILVRGPRQYGKSTWLERQLLATIERFGADSALYLNGDEITGAHDLAERLRSLARSFAARASVRRLFVDEITAVPGWQHALKSVIDAGDLRGVLVVTTGSRATDLRRGTERLPGRRGKLARTTYLFTPISYGEFRRVCRDSLGANALPAYVLAGGSPPACAAVAHHGRLPEYVPEMIRDWVYGEAAASGRQRTSLVAVMQQLFRHGGSAVGQAKLAREAGLANNTVAAGFVELLADLMCVGIAQAWDASRKVALARKPAKFPFINLLAAVAWHPSRPRSIEDLQALLATAEQGAWWEWLAAQELWRRAALRGDEFPEHFRFWQGGDHEIDFVLDADRFLEVKRGSSGPLDFAWFRRVFPKGQLTVITRTPFATDHVNGVTMEDFLLSPAG